MTVPPFVFSSANLPRIKAQQLQKTFSFLKLSVAQEATARALGYASWFECVHQDSGQPSLPDEEAGLPLRVARYYRQAGVLMGLGIAPSEADCWVRAWGLTGRPTLAPKEGVPVYYRWNEVLGQLERGEIGEEELIQQFGGPWHSKYPDIDRPRRVCAGVILGPCGKYPYYAVDPAINARIPIYLRGPSSLYHYQEGADVLAMVLPGFPKDAPYVESGSPRLNRLQYEWHHGRKHPESSELLMPQLEAAALAHPDAMVAITMRPMPMPGAPYPARNTLTWRDPMALASTRHALACLRGRDFAAFLRAKGVIDSSKVVWYRDLGERFDWECRNWLAGDARGRGAAQLPIFADAHKHQPSLPLYSYPFMTAPMSSDEYRSGHERVCLLPLDEEYRDDAGDDDRGGARGGGRPHGFLH